MIDVHTHTYANNNEEQAWGMHSDDPRMDPLFEKCAELGMPVNIHLVEPKWMYEKMDSTNDGIMNISITSFPAITGLSRHWHCQTKFLRNNIEQTF